MKLINVPEQITNYLKFMKNIKQASDHTLRAYGRDLSQSLGQCQELGDQEILPICRKAQVSWADLEPSSRNRKTAVLKSFLGFLFDQKLISTDWRHQLKAPKIPKKLPHYISVDEMMAVLKGCTEPSERALFLLLYGGGLRISEACGLKWSQVDLPGRKLRVLGKGGRERLVVLPELAVQSLRDLPRSGPSIWGLQPLDTRVGFTWIRDLGKKAGLMKPLNPHALRHSFATHLLSSGANLRTLQELLGHTSLTATEKYTHLTVDQLARTLEACHPLSQSTQGLNKVLK